VAAARDITLGRADPLFLVIHLSFLLVVIALGVFAALITFRRALRD
jgi:hypothetical protein